MEHVATSGVDNGQDRTGTYHGMLSESVGNRRLRDVIAWTGLAWLIAMRNGCIDGFGVWTFAGCRLKRCWVVQRHSSRFDSARAPKVVAFQGVLIPWCHALQKSVLLSDLSPSWCQWAMSLSSRRSDHQWYLSWRGGREPAAYRRAWLPYKLTWTRSAALAS